MRHLNYNHLLYFWTVAREGSIARASEVLHLTPQTISGQLKLLEESVGEALFQRVGRGLVLSDAGHVVNQYADEIFTLGAELAQRVRSKEPGMPVAFNVGIVSSIPKLIAYRILAPALSLPDPIRIVCQEGDLEHLLGELAVHRLDLVLSDRAIPTGLSVKAYNHLLGESNIALFAQRRMAARYARRFPDSLDDAPMLLPVITSALRRSLDDWFDSVGVGPRVVAEFDDSALLKAFGEAGSGIFPAPSAIATEVEHMYHARIVGLAGDVKDAFFAISPERKLKHPAVVQITESARSALFD
ncbi:MAG: transcriptional activator NhaR [Gammaproteobacteria bacterium]|nr:transcriptional activator NhaR [Gammaproteobacteria bacterium]